MKKHVSVALGMFALKASNLLLLDEPSNHLDVGCISGLAKALSGWGCDDRWCRGRDFTSS